jgi:hypothetical protein
MKKITFSVIILAFLPFFTWAQETSATHYGNNSGVDGVEGSYFGNYAGYSAVAYSGNYNTLIGSQTGRNITTGTYNSLLGASCGLSLTTGNYNVMLGNNAGRSAVTSSNNTFLGYQAGYKSTISNNIYIGYNSGYNNTIGSANTLIGVSAGYNNAGGSGNVFIGYQAGYNETSANKLYIDNSNTSSPLIYGDFSTNALTINGSFKVGTSNLYVNNTNNTVGIGTTDTKGYKLGVNGNIIATEVVVKEYVNWPDYVFENNYKLTELTEVEAYVKEKKHLPGVPSANEVKDNGVALGEMNKILLQKIEEMMLYMIQQQKEIDALKQQINNK